MTPPQDRAAIPAQGLWLLAALIIIWGTHWPIMKFSLGEIPIFTFRAVCAVLGAAGLFAIARGRGDSLSVPRKQWAPLVLASLLNITGWFYFSALALTLMPASRGTIIAYTMPLWAFLLGIPVLKERPPAGQWLGLLLGLGGVAVLVGEDVRVLGEAPLGVVAMLGAAMCFGFGAVVQKRVQWQIPHLTMTGWQIAIGGLPLVAAAAIADLDRWQPVSWMALAGLAYTVVLGVIFGVTTWLRLVHLLPVPVASLSMLLVPIVGVISSALLLGEELGWAEWTALVLVVAAVSRVVPLPSWRR